MKWGTSVMTGFPIAIRLPPKTTLAIHIFHSTLVLVEILAITWDVTYPNQNVDSEKISESLALCSS